MILINVFMIFTCIFALLYYDNASNFDEDFTVDLLRSFAMYARVFGPLPKTDQGKIPWVAIGISPTFFKHNNHYEPSAAFTEPKLLSIDHVQWIFSNFLAIKGTVIGTNICMLSGTAFQLNGVSFSRDELLAYAHYNIKYHNTKVPNRRDYEDIETYPNMEATVLGYLC